jgi:HAD superfamily hydrolase (TIGR01458 family)
MIKGVIFDVDGVLVYQGEVCPGAVETTDQLRDKGIPLRFLTNSTLKSRASCAHRLRQRGFRIFDEEVVTASSATARYLKGLDPRSCWVMLEREGLDEFKGFHQDAEDPEYLVVGDNRSRFDFEHMNRALRVLLGGARLIGMQDELLDSSMGEVELNVGAWVKMLEAASGVPAVYIGKPNSYGFELAVESMGLDKRSVIMVGDRVPSDVKGAKGFGIRSVLLRTGEFKESDLDGGPTPDFIFDSIEEILGLPGLG